MYVVLGANTVESYSQANELSFILGYSQNKQSPYKLRIAFTTDELSTHLQLRDSHAVKYSTETPSSSNTNIVDNALTIGAYISRIDLNASNSFRDYIYTPEHIKAESLDAMTLSQLEQNNYNFVSRIGNKTLNFGGDLMTGDNIITDFGTLAIENDLTYALLDAVSDKQYMNDAGINTIVSTMENRITRYTKNGFLEVNSIYSGNDIVITYNNRDFSVIKNGTPLVKGFKIFTIPVRYITLADRNDRRLPPIYVVLNTLSGVRTLEVVGSVV